MERPALIALPRVIGHRGAAGLAPENTLAGFARAVEEGCAWIEFDVALTRDLVPVVLHDAELSRTTGLDMRLRDLHSAALAELDAGAWFGPEWEGEPVPTLAQALDACAVLGLTPNVEIKGDSGRLRATSRAVAALIHARWPAGRPLPLVSSFSLRALYHMRMAAPGLPLGLLMSGRARSFWTLHARVLRCASVHVDPPLATASLVARAHKRGLAVAVYTVNDAAEAGRLFDLGADAVFSDRPDLVREAAAGRD